MKPGKPIIFFDGYCGLCNRLVNFLLSTKARRLFLFTPIQGETGKKLLPAEIRNNLATIVIYEEEELHFKSKAIFQIIDIMGGIYKVFDILKIFPGKWLDSCYDLVSKYRYRFFGKRKTCRMPSPEDKEIFLP